MTSEEIDARISALELKTMGELTADERAAAAAHLNTLPGHLESTRGLARYFLAKGDTDRATRAAALADRYQRALDAGHRDLASYLAGYRRPEPRK
jgi:hypothetical protein